MMQELWKTKEQRTLAPLSVPGATSAGSIRVVSGSGFRYVVPFPYRLHEMLSNVDTKFDSSIVSWLPSGKLFKVHDPSRFVESVIPSAFKQKSLKSFQRQLHLYGFQRVHEGVDKGAYFHEKFLRDDRDLCLSITRTKAPKRSRATPSMKKNDKTSQKLAAFKSQKKNTSGNTMQINKNSFANTVSLSQTNQSAVAISHTIFDDFSQLQRTPMCSDTNTKGPLHRYVSSDEVSSSQSENTSTFSNSIHNANGNIAPSVHVPSSKTHQQLEGSIADTCQWLINAGVPISAFDPVAIGDISNTSVDGPEPVYSCISSFSQSLPQQSTISPTPSCNMSSYTESKSMQSLQFNNNRDTNSADINSLFQVGLSSQNTLSLSSSFPSGVAVFNDDPLLTDLLPGENLPLVDDSLWAL